MTKFETRAQAEGRECRDLLFTAGHAERLVKLHCPAGTV